MNEHQPLPVQGYTPQSDEKIHMVNGNKQLEEIVLRRLDTLKDRDDVDGRCLAVAITKVQEAFMWANRGIMQPRRVDIGT